MQLVDHYAEYEKYLRSRQDMGKVMSEKLREIARRYSTCEFSDVFLADEDFEVILNGEAEIRCISVRKGVYNIELEASDLYEMEFGNGRWDTARYNNEYERFDGDLPSMGSVNKRVFSDLALEFQQTSGENVVPFFDSKKFEDIIVEEGGCWQDYVRRYEGDHIYNLKVFDMMLALQKVNPDLVQHAADFAVRIYSQFVRVKKDDLLEYANCISGSPAFMNKGVLEIYWRD